MSEISSAIDDLVTRFWPYGSQPYGARLIVGVYDDPDGGSGATKRPRPVRFPIGDNQDDLSVPSHPAGSPHGGDTQIITGFIDPLRPAGPHEQDRGRNRMYSDPGVPKAGLGSTATGSSDGDMQLITGSVDDPSTSVNPGGPLQAVSVTTPAPPMGEPDPLSAFTTSHSTGGDVQLITGRIDLPDGAAESTSQISGESSGVSSQLHQLITAMANFGGQLSSPSMSASNAIESEAARQTLAASLHF